MTEQKDDRIISKSKGWGRTQKRYWEKWGPKIRGDLERTIFFEQLEKPIPARLNWFARLKRWALRLTPPMSMAEKKLFELDRMEFQMKINKYKNYEKTFASNSQVKNRQSRFRAFIEKIIG